MVINMPVPLPVPLEFLWELLVVEISGLQKQKQEGGPPPNSESDVIYSLTKLTGISVCLSLSYSLFLSLFCFFQSKFKKIQAFSQQLASVYSLVPWRFNGRHHLQSTRGSQWPLWAPFLDTPASKNCSCCSGAATCWTFWTATYTFWLVFQTFLLTFQILSPASLAKYPASETL